MSRYDDDYDYDYRDTSSDIDDLYIEAEIDDSYNQNEDEPWMEMEENHGNHSSWDNYYHNITDELIDD